MDLYILDRSVEEAYERLTHLVSFITQINAEGSSYNLHNAQNHLVAALSSLKEAHSYIKSEWETKK